MIRGLISRTVALLLVALPAVAAGPAGPAPGPVRIIGGSPTGGCIAGAVALAALLDGHTGVDGFAALFALTAVAGLASAVAGAFLPGRVATARMRSAG